MAPAAFWSSWADALQMIQENFAKWRVDRLDGVHEAEGCIKVTVELDRQGFVGCPAWVELELGARPPPTNVWATIFGTLCNLEEKLLRKT